MRILTITCHDVYNAGASLQAYALQRHLAECGHDTEIINYKPDYLSGHYRYTTVNTRKYDRSILRELYIITHLPRRLKANMEGRKQRFDQFRSEYFKLTSKRYQNCDELSEDAPIADCYIAGSDQIWNPYLPNGADPSFYLQFAPDDKRKISYAASFATDCLPEEHKQSVKPWLKRLDTVSVREQSGVGILHELGIEAISVCDPVFLLERKEWQQLATQCLEDKPYVLIYDFDESKVTQETALKLAKDIGAEVLSVFPVREKRIRSVRAVGPREFLSLILHAEAVVSNSFHATAFALIFHKELFVRLRDEDLNARMIDLLTAVGLKKRLMKDCGDLKAVDPINWTTVDCILNQRIVESKEYLASAITGES